MKTIVDIEHNHLVMVLNILKKNIHGHADVWVFGSRAGKTKKPFSDLDLAIDAKKELPFDILVSLKHDFEESDLPYKVDIVDWQAIDKLFQARLEPYRQKTGLDF